MANMKVFLENPDFANGYTQDPQRVDNSGPQYYYSKVKELNRG